MTFRRSRRRRAGNAAAAELGDRLRVRIEGELEPVWPAQLPQRRAAIEPRRRIVGERQRVRAIIVSKDGELRNDRVRQRKRHPAAAIERDRNVDGADGVAAPLSITDSVVAALLTVNGTLNASRLRAERARRRTVVGAGVPAATGKWKACIPVDACCVADLRARIAARRTPARR